MTAKRHRARATTKPDVTRIQTSILELMQELSTLTNDDTLVVAAVRNIFGSHNVKLTGGAIAIRIAGNESPEYPFQQCGQGRKRARVG